MVPLVIGVVMLVCLVITRMAAPWAVNSQSR